MNLIGAYCQFDPLEEVWLGDCYPIEFYRNYDKDTKLAFEYVTDITKTDLDHFQSILESLNIIVKRPVFTNNPVDYEDSYGNLLKPPISPRDDNMVLGNTLYHLRNNFKIDPWQSELDEYCKSGSNVISSQFLEKYGYLEPPSIVRLGEDIFIDIDTHNHSWELIKREVIPEWTKEYNVHECQSDGHADSVFCVVGPNRILTSHWKQDYTKEFPNWEVHHIPKSNKSKNFQRVGEDKTWWIEDKQQLGQYYPAFNKSIEKVAENWIGNSLETEFEVNSLMVNESLILTTGIPTKETQDWFKKHKIDWIPIEFRTRAFWDAGIHCLTVDIRRNGNKRKILL